jgi:hypothetical protein
MTLVSDLKIAFLRPGFRFFGACRFAGCNLRLQCAVSSAPSNFLFAKPVESRGIATCFGHDFLFLDAGGYPGGKRLE